MAVKNRESLLDEITRLGDALAKLTVLEAKALGDYVEDVHKIRKAVKRRQPNASKNLRSNLAKVVAQIRTLETFADRVSTDSPDDPAEATRQVRTLLIEHLGSADAAEAWLDSAATGYPGTARDAIRDGQGDLVIQDLKSQWGPSPSYA